MAETGVLLVNLGTPDSPAVADVRRHLREFLGDPAVLDLPAPLRWLLLHGVILPRRPRRSAEAYAKIWSPEGSPLLVHGRALCRGVAGALGAGFRVELGMRYGAPGLGDALARLVDAGVSRIVALPLFPHRAEAASGSAEAALRAAADARPGAPPLAILDAFHDDPAYLAAWAAVAGPALASFRPEFVLMSYHGLPERQVRRADPSARHCLASQGCCEPLRPANRGCYRAQCFATSRALVGALGLSDAATATSFQSRLGRRPWIRPHTDAALAELAGRGVRRLAVLCPSFVADCLETLEEIGIRGRALWHELGGEELLLVPSLNAEPVWVRGVAAMIRRAADHASSGTASSSDPAAARPEASVSETPTPSR